MKLTPPAPTLPPDKGLFNVGEARRMRWMIFALVLVAVAFVITIRKENERRREAAAREAELGESAAPPTVVVTPEIDGEALDALVRDATPAERVLIETPALARALRDTAPIGDALFEPMGGSVLDAARCAELVGEDAALRKAARGTLLRAYGWIEALERRPAVADLPEHVFGRLRQEDGSRVSFAASSAPERVLLDGDFVRVDGVFLEALRSEDVQGWIDTPLIVGPRVVASFPRLLPPPELDPLVFAAVTDDSVTEITGMPFEPYWELIAYVRELDGSQIDWAAAPLLDREGMAELALDGDAFRARPVRIPPSQVMDCFELAQPENPLRVTHMSEGWLGNQDWFGPVQGLVQFVSPDLGLGIRRKDEVVARGFFLKRVAYETAEAGIGVAPFLVLYDVELHDAPKSTTWRTILMTFGGGLVFLVGLLFFLLRRDQARSAELQAELTQRRRARRAAARSPAS
jgi:hypothetical protein